MIDPFLRETSRLTGNLLKSCARSTSSRRAGGVKAEVVVIGNGSQTHHVCRGSGGNRKGKQLAGYSSAVYCLSSRRVNTHCRIARPEILGNKESRDLRSGRC